MQTNDKYLIQLLVLDRNNWNYLSVRKPSQSLMVYKQKSCNSFQNKTIHLQVIYA